MSLKAINESYRALLAVNGRGIHKHTRQMVAKLLSGVASNGGKVTIGGSGFWWQRYYRGRRQIMAMQRKELIIINAHEEFLKIQYGHISTRFSRNFEVNSFRSIDAF